MVLHDVASRLFDFPSAYKDKLNYINNDQMLDDIYEYTIERTHLGVTSKITKSSKA